MFAEFLVFGCFSFWASIAAFTICFLWAVEEEAIGAAILFTIAAAIVYLLFGELKVVLSLCFFNPLTSTLIILCYFIIGGVWSMVKWANLVRGKRIEYDECKKEHISQSIADGKTKDMAEEKWIHELSVHGSTIRTKFFDLITYGAPRPSDHKDKLYVWIFYWPFSVIWACTADLVKNIWEFAYSTLKNTYKKISVKIMGTVSADFEKVRDLNAKK